MSYTKLLYHVILRTKYNQPTLTLEHDAKLYGYILGIVKNKKSVLYRINGMEDHLHLLVGIHPSISVADFVRDVKSSTAKWLRGNDFFPLFKSFSEGYAALTYSMSEKEKVINYIKNQRKHHVKKTFEEEYRYFLTEMGVSVDERYIFAEGVVPLRGTDGGG